MKVLYYTSASLLDTSIEIIKIVKKHVDLHVLIEITPGSKAAGITNVAHLPKDTLVSPVDILKDKDYQKMKFYFDGLSNIYFAVHKKREILSSLITSFRVWKYIKKLKPDIIHIELSTVRCIGLLPALFFSKKIFLSIHDPVLHTGEHNWRASVIRFLFNYFPIQKGYFFYSKFSKTLFENYYKHNNHKKWVIQMHPLSYFKNLKSVFTDERKHILFFGRISPYKGIDILLKAMPLVLQKFPNELLIIAGQSIQGYSLNGEIAEEYKGNIKIINRYIPNEELYDMIRSAKFIVCPYKDATQSGVLMTAFALNTPVIASRVGAFPEYIEENKTSLLTPANDYYKLSEKIIYALKDEFYKKMEKHLILNSDIDKWELNKDILLSAYKS